MRSSPGSERLPADRDGNARGLGGGRIAGLDRQLKRAALAGGGKTFFVNDALNRRDAFEKGDIPGRRIRMELTRTWIVKAISNPYQRLGLEIVQSGQQLWDQRLKIFERV
jgi:hypothetical protein